MKGEEKQQNEIKVDSFDSIKNISTWGIPRARSSFPPPFNHGSQLGMHSIVSKLCAPEEPISGVGVLAPSQHSRARSTAAWWAA